MLRRIAPFLFVFLAPILLAACQQPGEPLGATVNQDIYNAQRNLGLIPPAPAPPAYAAPAPAPEYPAYPAQPYTAQPYLAQP